MEISILHMIPGARAARGIAVIIDVFRAFTVEAYIVNRGAERLLAVGDEKIAYDYKRRDGSCVLIGERGGVKLPGFDYGNSPSEIEKVDFTGKTVIHTTSAGTQGIANAVNADEVLTGSFVNARATAEYIKAKDPACVSLVCMGLSAKRETEEDNLCAEYLKALLSGESPDIGEKLSALKYTSGAKFFDPAQSAVFPEKDFYLCTETDKFNFVLRAEKGERGSNYIKKADNT